jgi:hypothetical protein
MRCNGMTEGCWRRVEGKDERKCDGKFNDKNIFP